MDSKHFTKLTENEVFKRRSQKQIILYIVPFCKSKGNIMA